jgi:hypothetical protein
MHKLTMIWLLLSLALCGCATSGPARVCPQLPSLPANVMQPPPKPLLIGPQLQSELFDSATPQTNAKPTLAHK